MLDPYPHKVLLAQKEVMHMLSMDKTTWYEFRADPSTGFPEPVEVGRTANGNPRLRWHKWQVIAWISGLRPPPKPPEGAPGPPPEAPRKKS